ncbi:hypothetical protein NC652_024770 [Populus alba x Populus x berolinensis]|nr:hypothetical protein NC652_024770 [Populus alba x Populus x berolinensis]
MFSIITILTTTTIIAEIKTLSEKTNKNPPSHPFSFSFQETTRNLANLEGLRARLSLKQAISDCQNDDEECRRWRFRLSSSMAAFTWGSLLRITFFLLLIAAVVFGFFTLPVEKILKDFLLWVEQDLGPWGPLVLAVAYIPLTVLAVPAAVLTLGGGYLFGLPLGFVADSIGATIGAGAAFLLGRTNTINDLRKKGNNIGRSFVVSKLKDYPKFRSVAIAIQKSGFKYYYNINNNNNNCRNQNETTRNLANLEGLRARLSLKQAISDCQNDDEECRRWRFQAFLFDGCFYMGITFFLLLIAAVVFGFFTLPVEKVPFFYPVFKLMGHSPELLWAANGQMKMLFLLRHILKDFLLWVEQDLGPWGPLVLAVAYIPLTVLAVPAAVLTLGGGYLFGLPLGFVADSIGATIGAGAAFLLGRTNTINDLRKKGNNIGRSFVVSKLKDYPKFRSVAIAIQKSGFKIVLLLRLVPLLPFNMLNYLLSVTPVPIGEYMLASWIGMMVFIILGLLVSVVLIFCVTKVAKSALDKALAENEDLDFIFVADIAVNLNQPLIIKIDPSEDKHEK